MAGEDCGGDEIPVASPPRGGPLGRSRGRLSASSLTTYLRCPRQWLLSYQVGLHTPTSLPQILGVLLEEAICKLFMSHPPPSVSSEEDLRLWLDPLVNAQSTEVYQRGMQQWQDNLWKHQDQDWSQVSLESITSKIWHGLDFFLEEVDACYQVQGGPYLEHFRAGKQPFSVPAPTLSQAPVFPVPEKVSDVELRQWHLESPPMWQPPQSPIQWNEAWECARPWFKDYRIHQPQRLYHPDDWASGELDVVLRWDGTVRIVDIKAGSTQSTFSISLEHQLRFYAWLWHETHDGQLPRQMEGWYLETGERSIFPSLNVGEIDTLRDSFFSIHHQMQSLEQHLVSLPALPEEACTGQQAGCGWCAISRTADGEWQIPTYAQWIQEIHHVSINSPFQSLESIQGRVHVKGRLTGAWGPLPNHFGEPVLGAVLVVGDQHITLEETEPGEFQTLHQVVEKEVLVFDALPGVWRDQARLYLDAKSRIEVAEGGVEQQGGKPFTRLGLLRTRANVTGHVLSLQLKSGTRLDGKPWTMLTFILWDGQHVAEVVAFGSSISQRLLVLKPGMLVNMTGVEIGWRAGLLQLRIDARKTRLDLPKINEDRL